MQFRQLESGLPSDIEAIMTRAQAEDYKDKLEEVDAQETDSFSNVIQALESAEVTAEEVTVVIPGHEVGENGALIPELDEYLDDLNNRALEEAEKDE